MTERRAVWYTALKIDDLGVMAYVTLLAKGGVIDYFLVAIFIILGLPSVHIL